VLISFLAFVDDLVLIASSPEQLRVALSIVHNWARKTRMRLNIGANKTAIMVWGRGRLSVADNSLIFHLGSRLVPFVSVYKYLGVRIGCSGGWLHHFNHMADKAITKTREVAAWARQYKVPLTLVVRVWDLYVERAVLYGANVCQPPAYRSISA
jgi:hypothetical protein